MDDLKVVQQARVEYDAWKLIMDEWKKLFPDRDINDPTYNPLINAMRYWGEELVALRLLQEGTVRGTALVESRQQYERSVR